MKFVPRFTRPEAGNKYYITAGNGGYSYAIQGYPTDPDCDVLSNCVGYAYGRFNEIGGYGYCKYLSAVNAENFIQYAGPCKVGQVPQVGACMVWQKGPTLYSEDGPGHVAIVEQVISSTEVITSESGWGYTIPFVNERRSQGADGRWGMGASYTFLGFIYNPACSGLEHFTSTDIPTITEEPRPANPLLSFLNVAESHVGDDSSWTYTNSTAIRSLPWSGAFVNAVTRTVGSLLDVVIPDTCSSSDIARLGVKYNMGRWIPGPAQGVVAYPQPGDIALFRTKSGTRSDTYDSDSAGIVVECNSNFAYVVKGDVNGKVKKLNFSLKDLNISYSKGVVNGYYRPNWSMVGSSVSDVPTFESAPLYDVATTEKDATLRQVCYLNSRYEPSISPSDIKLTIVNYTSMLSAFYTLMQLSTSKDSIASRLSGLDAVPRTIVYYFMLRGLTFACSIALLSYLQAMSNLDTGRSSAGYGICRWTGNRQSMMIKMVGDDWANNLSGQLDYMCYELKTSYSYILTNMSTLSNDESGSTACVQLLAKDFNPVVPVSISKCQLGVKKFWSIIN